jgi:hypothetical protein
VPVAAVRGALAKQFNAHVTMAESSNTRDNQRAALLTRMQGLEPRTVEQHAFSAGLRHVLNKMHMSTEASAEALIELFSPETLTCSPCLKMLLLYVMMREVLRYVGITVEQRQGLHIPQAVVNAIYANDNTMKHPANSYMAN